MFGRSQPTRLHGITATPLTLSPPALVCGSVGRPRGNGNDNDGRRRRRRLPPLSRASACGVDGDAVAAAWRRRRRRESPPLPATPVCADELEVLGCSWSTALYLTRPAMPRQHRQPCGPRRYGAVGVWGGRRRKRWRRREAAMSNRVVKPLPAPSPRRGGTRASSKQNELAARALGGARFE